MAIAVIGGAVGLFSGGWRDGDLVLDGPGASLWVQLVLDHLRAGHGLSYWMPDLWLGVPGWSVAPALPVLSLVPLAAAVGADHAVQIACLAGQVVGGLGAYALARTLWSDHSAALVAGIGFALAPSVLQHVGAGAETGLWVLALAPWFLRSLLTALRTGRRRSLAAAGLFGGLAVAIQAEYAYGLIVFAAALVVLELGRAAGGRSDATVASVLRRSAVVVALVGGVLAHWIVPLLATKDEFVLNPDDIVRSSLYDGLGAQLGRDLGAFLIRPSGAAVIDFATDFFSEGFFYIGLVGLTLAVVATMFVPRRDDEQYLSPFLLASALCLWVATGAVALSHSTLGGSASFLFAVIGLLTGHIAATYLADIGVTGRWRFPVAAGLTGFFVAMPYIRPFFVLRSLLPLFSAIRFSRLYPMAAIGLALAGAFVVMRVARSERWFGNIAPRRRAAIAALIIGVAFIADVLPYRPYYQEHQTRIRPITRVLGTLDPADRATSRVATIDFGDPATVRAITSSGRLAAVGWPHPVAGKDAWRITGEATVSPAGMRDEMLALSATRYFLRPTPAKPTAAGVRTASIVEVPRSLPFVRSYNQVVTASNDGPAAELAAALAPRGVGVVTKGERTRALAAITIADLGSPRTCRAGAPPVGIFEGDVGRACSRRSWVGRIHRLSFAGGPGSIVGATFRATADGLSAVSVNGVRVSGLRLALHEYSGGRVGRRVAVAPLVASPPRERGLLRFAFPAVAHSAGREYAFLLGCPRCGRREPTQIVTVAAGDDDGDLVLNGVHDSSRQVQFLLDYPPGPSAASSTRVVGRSPRPGAWSVTANGRDPALIVVSEAYFPEWQVTVDGRPAPVVEADSALLGVVVPPGRHRVEFRYRHHWTVELGLLITALTAVVMAWMCRSPRRRRRRRRPKARTSVEEPG